jgi:D-3-phosphoglycerate dehydrogenase / 2-oxoglutarate reductase
MSRKLIVAHNPEHLPQFREKAHHFDTVYNVGDYSALSDAIADCDYLIPSLRYRLDRKFLMRAKRLRAVATPSTGTDHIDLEACGDLGISVISLKDEVRFLASVTSTAELAFSLILNAMRRVPFAFQHVLGGGWDASMFRGHELQGRIMGIIGFGRLGRMMGEYGLAFRMSVLACDPYRSVDMEGIRQVDLDELLMSSDIITIHVHLNETTAGMIGRDAFLKMKTGVVLVNTSRGAVIDSMALLKALEEGRVSAAGLDVIENELGAGSVYDSPLVKYARDHDNLIITPHMGGVTIEAQIKSFDYTLERLVELDREIYG